MTDQFVTSRLGANGETVLPKAVREALDLRLGDRIAYTINHGRVIMTAKRHPPARNDPFACFEEWVSEADTEGYASL